MTAEISSRLRLWLTAAKKRTWRRTQGFHWMSARCFYSRLLQLQCGRHCICCQGRQESPYPPSPESLHGDRHVCMFYKVLHELSGRKREFDIGMLVCALFSSQHTWKQRICDGIKWWHRLTCLAKQQKYSGSTRINKKESKINIPLLWRDISMSFTPTVFIFQILSEQFAGF